tara:strand:- start:148 stop:462 length:315 start_codon:yes stop_codon:yes gene_type:complete
MNNRIQVKQEVAIAQGILDKLVPGKVKVSAEYDSERRCNILIGEYDSHMGYQGKVHSSKSVWTESMDRFYTDCMMFIGFFKQRAKFMNATPEEQAAFNDHPSQF